MSVGFYFIPVGGKKRLSGGTSSDTTVIEQAFGGLPRTFSESDVPMLRAMNAAQCSGNKMGVTLYTSIADAVEQHGDIQVTAEY